MYKLVSVAIWRQRRICATLGALSNAGLHLRMPQSRINMWTVAASYSRIEAIAVRVPIAGRVATDGGKDLRWSVP